MKEKSSLIVVHQFPLGTMEQAQTQAKKIATHALKGHAERGKKRFPSLLVVQRSIFLENRRGLLEVKRVSFPDLSYEHQQLPKPSLTNIIMG